MSNHPNRSGGPSANPAPELVRETRRGLELSSAQAGALVHTSGRVWQQWEAGERRMHPAFWELFRIKTDARYAAQALISANPRSPR